MKRTRKYSFIRLGAIAFDGVVVDGVEVTIPARLGTCYWAILEFAYQHANHPVRPEELIDGVEHVMSDRDVLAWQRFCNEPNAKPWEERVLMNARILTRRGGQHPFGRRLEERGHRFDLEQDEACRTYFILRTSTVEPSRARPRGRPRRMS